MDYSFLNSKRKRFIPLYILTILLALLYVGYAIFYILTNEFGIKIIQYVIMTSSVILGVLFISFTVSLTEDIYTLGIRNLTFDEVVKNKITKGLNLKNGNFSKKDKSLKNSNLISKHHGYKILAKYKQDDIEIFEISMLSDMRFRGYIIRKKIENTELLEYAITNRRYYYLHRAKGLFKTTTDNKTFNNKFKIWTSRKYIFNNDKLDNIYNLSLGYRHFGLSQDKDYKYLLVSYPIKDGQKLFIPNVFEKIDDKFFQRINDEIVKIDKIINFSII